MARHTPLDVTPSPATIRAELARGEIEHQEVARKLSLSKFAFSRLIHGERRDAGQLLRDAFRVIREIRAAEGRH